MTINLKKSPNEQKKQSFDIVTTLMVFLFFSTFIACYWYTAQLEDKLKQAHDRLIVKTKEYEQSKNRVEDIDIFKKNIYELKNNIRILKTLGFSKLFIELSSILPNNMKVNDISVNVSIDNKKSSTVILSGVVNDKSGITPVDSISNFLKNVKKSKYVKNAFIINSIKNTNYSWKIEIEYDPKIEQSFEYAIGII